MASLNQRLASFLERLLDARPAATAPGASKLLPISLEDDARTLLTELRLTSNFPSPTIRFFSNDLDSWFEGRRVPSPEPPPQQQVIHPNPYSSSEDDADTRGQMESDRREDDLPPTPQDAPLDPSPEDTCAFCGAHLRPIPETDDYVCSNRACEGY